MILWFFSIWKMKRVVIMFGKLFKDLFCVVFFCCDESEEHVICGNSSNNIDFFFSIWVMNAENNADQFLYSLILIVYLLG